MPALMKAYRTLVISHMLYGSQILFLGPIEQFNKRQLTFFGQMLTIHQLHSRMTENGPFKNFNTDLEDYNQLQVLTANSEVLPTFTILAAHECYWSK